MAQPAGQRRADAIDVLGRDVDEGRRAGAAVEELVGAADREVSPGAGEVDGQRTRRVGQVPDRQCTDLVRGPREAGHVVPAPGPVVDLGQHQHRDPLVQGLGHRFRRDEADLVAAAERSDQPVHHVEIGREVAVIGEDDASLGPHLQGRGHRLVDLDRQRVAHHHGAGRSADQPADAVADPCRLIHPARVVPAADQHLAPFVVQQAVHPFARRQRQRTEGVAVQVDHPFGQVESGPGSTEVRRHVRCLLDWPTPRGGWVRITGGTVSPAGERGEAVSPIAHSSVHDAASSCPRLPALLPVGAPAWPWYRHSHRSSGQCGRLTLRRVSLRRGRIEPAVMFRQETKTPSVVARSAVTEAGRTRSGDAEGNGIERADRICSADRAKGVGSR